MGQTEKLVPHHFRYRDMTIFLEKIEHFKKFLTGTGCHRESKISPFLIPYNCVNVLNFYPPLLRYAIDVKCQLKKYNLLAFCKRFINVGAKIFGFLDAASQCG